MVKFPELPAPACMLLSLPLLTGGIFLMSWSILHFLKARGTPVPVNPPPTLVSSGPYAYVRNPMLSGIFFLLFGLGFLTGLFSLTFIYTPLFILLMVIELKKVEEPELEKRFGAEYRAYRNSVPMFIPGQKGRRPEEKNKSGVKNP
jgi:protein-S-isoprenylcysteine O-methyltransferase Ste14